MRILDKCFFAVATCGIVLIFLGVVPVQSQTLDGSSCPPGYRCVLEDPLTASIAQDVKERHQEELARCRQQEHEDEDLLVGLAAPEAMKGNPYAADEALDMARRLHRCGD